MKKLLPIYAALTAAAGFALAGCPTNEIDEEPLEETLYYLADATEESNTCLFPGYDMPRGHLGEIPLSYTEKSDVANLFGGGVAFRVSVNGDKVYSGSKDSFSDIMTSEFNGRFEGNRLIGYLDIDYDYENDGEIDCHSKCYLTGETWPILEDKPESLEEGITSKKLLRSP